MSRDVDGPWGGGRSWDPRANRPENVRATIHMYAWGALSRLLIARDRAEGTKYETAARSAYAEVERLLDEVEADAERAGWPLRRPPPFKDGVER